MNDALVTMTGIVKQFGGSQVVMDANLKLRAGHLHALLGPNGAGKSTLIKILSGVYRADGGTVDTRQRDGRPGARIGFIHQNLALVDGLTVRENLNLDRGGITLFAGIIDRKTEVAEAEKSLDAVDAKIDPETPLVDLSLGEKTLVATARLFNKTVDVMVLDETSAALSRRESDWLYAEARRFAEDGGAVLVVTHRLAEVAKHCDETTVMRDGKVVFNGQTPELHELHSLMAADVLEAPPGVADFKGTEVVVRLSAAKTDLVGPVDLTVHAGEVIALVGPLSSNLYQLGHVIAGRTKPKSGTVQILGGGVAFVPENCQSQALLPGLSVRENMSISRVRQINRLGAIRRSKEAEEVDEQMHVLDIQPDDPDKLANLLSGGNQQKVVLGRAALISPRCYVLCEPTRGVDVKTRHAIYRFIRRVSSGGAAVVVVTIDVDDAFAVAHRIGLVRDGGRIDSVHERGYMSIDQVLEEVDS